MSFSVFWGLPCHRVRQSGRSLEKLDHQGDTLVFRPLVTVEMCTSQAHIAPLLWWCFCCFWAESGGTRISAEARKPRFNGPASFPVIPLRPLHYPGVLGMLVACGSCWVPGPELPHATGTAKKKKGVFLGKLAGWRDKHQVTNQSRITKPLHLLCR